MILLPRPAPHPSDGNLQEEAERPRGELGEVLGGEVTEAGNHVGPLLGAGEVTERLRLGDLPDNLIV